MASNKEDITTHMTESSMSKDFTKHSSSSLYAMQVSLKSLKSLCERQEVQIGALEEENKRLHEEIGKLRKNSICQDDKNHFMSQAVCLSSSELAGMQKQVTFMWEQYSALALQMLHEMGENRQLKHKVLQQSQLNASLSAGSAASSSIDATDGVFQTENSAAQLHSQSQMEMSPTQLLDALLAVKNNLLLQQSKLKNSVRNLHEQKTRGIQAHEQNRRPPQNETLNTDVAFRSVSLDDDLEALRAWGTPQTSVLPRSTSPSIDQRDRESSSIEVNAEALPQAEDLNVDDRTCPICAAYLPMPFKEYEKHVIGHFDDEDSLLQQFVVLT